MVTFSTADLAILLAYTLTYSDIIHTLLYHSIESGHRYIDVEWC